MHIMLHYHFSAAELRTNERDAEIHSAKYKKNCEHRREHGDQFIYSSPNIKINNFA